MALVRKSIFFAICVASTNGYGQATPTASAPAPYSQFSLPDVGGSLRYALTASESILTGYNGTTGQGASAYTNLSGDVAYLTSSPTHPFSVVYAGGYLVGNSTFPSYFYQSLSLSQAVHGRYWDFIAGDTISYLPQTPIGTLSGIPGAGDLNLQSVQVSTGPEVGILTTYATRVNNAASGTLTRKLTAGTNLSISGADTIQRYTGSSTSSQGIDNDQQTASVNLEHRLSERTSLGGQYGFSNSSFTSSTLLGPGARGFQTHSAQLFVTRQLTPHLNLIAGAGPQWIAGGTQGGVTSGTSTILTASVALGYTGRNYTAGLTYSRGTNNGNGVVVGARQDSLVANISRPFLRIYNVGGIVAFNHSAQLGNSTLANFDSSGVIAGGQMSGQLRQSLSAFASYTVQRQLYSGFQPAGIAFNGLTQYVTVGLTYSPKPIFRK